MNPIAQGLAAGYTIEQIVAYLTKAFPGLKSKISKARSQGKSIEEILGFMSKGMETKYPSSMTEAEIHGANDKKEEMLVKHGLKTAATAVIGSGIVPLAARAIQRALPSNLTNLMGGSSVLPQVSGQQNPQTPQPGQQQQPQSPQQSLPQQAIPSAQQPPISNVSPNIPQSTNPVQSKPISTNITQILSNHKLKDQVDKLLTTQKDPKAVAAILYSKFPEEMKAFQKESGKNMEDAIADYIQESVPRGTTENVPESTELVERPITNMDSVGTPHGVGEVEAIRNGKAIVNVDGKKHQINEDELIQSPLPEKDLADLYDDLISGVEKETGEDVSRMVNFAGYDPNKNSLAFLPHDGGLYIYDEITPEQKEQLTNILNTRKTSGENFIGAWKAGSKSPIGAAMSKLIRDLQAQAGGKGKEYSMKFDTVYSAFEPAVKAKKKKKKKK